MTAGVLALGLAGVALLGWAVFRLHDWRCAARGHPLRHQRLLSVSKGGRLCLVRRSCGCGRVHKLVRIFGS